MNAGAVKPRHSRAEHDASDLESQTQCRVTDRDKSRRFGSRKRCTVVAAIGDDRIMTHWASIRDRLWLVFGLTLIGLAFWTSLGR